MKQREEVWPTDTDFEINIPMVAKVIGVNEITEEE